MFSGRQIPTGTSNVDMEKVFAQFLESKKRIVEQFKQQVDFYDRHLASKCLLSGVNPPSWLWSPSLPSQTSELNKEEIISGLLFPQSRSSIICPSSRPFSYQQPVNLLADNVVRQDLTSVVNNPLKEQLLEEEPQQPELSHNSIRRFSKHSQEKDANIASPRDVHEEEGLPESVSISCREKQNSLSPEYSQNRRVEISLDATSLGCSQGKTVPKSVSTTGCERKPPSPRLCQDETEPNTCLDPGIPFAKMQRSKSRQKALELRSSAKASKSRSNSKNELKPSPLGNIGLEIASLRSDNVSEINLFKHDENDEKSRDDVENSNSQGKGGNQCFNLSSSTESSTPHKKLDTVQKPSSGNAYASIVPEFLLESGCVNETDILQSIATTDELSCKVDKQVNDPQSRSCNETAYLDGGARSKSSSHNYSRRKQPQSISRKETAYLDDGMRSKSSSQDRSQRKRQKSSNSFSGDFPSRNSNPSRRADHEFELPHVIPSTKEVSLVTDAGTSIFQSETITRSRSKARENRSKTEPSGSVKSSSIDVEPRDSVSSGQGGHVKESLSASPVDVECGHVKESLSASPVDVECGHVKESLIPFTVYAEGLVVENIASDDQPKEKGEYADTNRCSSAGKVSQTGNSIDEETFAGTIEDSLSKAALLGFVESSSVKLHSRHSVMKSDDESVLLKPVTVTGEALLVDEDKNGGSTEVSSISKSRSLSKTDITVVDPVVVEYTLLESDSLVENLNDHSKRCDISCEYKEVQPQTSLTKGGSNQCHGRMSCPRSPAIVEKSANGNKALFHDSYHKSAEKQLEVRERNSSLGTNDLPVFVKPEIPHFDDDEECSFDEIPINSREKSTMEKAPAPASAARVFDVSSLTDSEIHLSADTERNEIEDHNGLEKEMIPETESPVSLTGLKVGENESPESNTFTGHADALTKRPQHEASSDKGVPPNNRNMACTETGESHGPENPIQESFCSSSCMGSPQLQNKRRRTLDKLTSRLLSSNPREDILDSYSVRETVHQREEVICQNQDHYDVELQKMIGSASTDHYAVELQKMIGSASSAELRFDECFLFKEAGSRSPASLSCRPELLSVQRSQIAPDHKVGSGNTNLLPCAGDTSHPLLNRVGRDSDGSPCLPPLGLLSSVGESPPVLEGFIIQTGDENQSSSKNHINHDSFHLPRTSAESAAIMEQICKSACTTTPSLNLAKTFEFSGKLDLDQSVSTELLDGMYFSQNLEGSSVFDSLGINHDYTRSCTESSSADDRKFCTSPAEKLWYLQKSSSSEKRVIQTPDLPCISEENENVDEEAECTNTPKSMIPEKRGSSIPDLPCIAEENENIDEIAEATYEASDSERENVPAERKPLGDVNEDCMKFHPSVSEAKIPVDRQSLDSIDTAFSFSSKCNSIKSKGREQNGGNRRLTGRGKENKSGAGARRNVKPPSSRFSKPKLSCNSSLTTVGPKLAEKVPRHNNIVSNITSFVPLVQQQKPAAPLITGKRDVKVKALEAAEATKRITEQKENDRKMKKEAMKLERARQEQENLRKQEMEKKKKEEDRKKKDAELAWKQEMEKKKKEEERKRKEFEMADRKRQREEEDKKLKEAKRQRTAEIQRQQREADQKLQAEKELKRQAMDAKIKAQKELKENQSHAENTRGQANTRIRGVRPKSNSSDDTNASRSSRDDDFKVINNPGKMSEESYDISPYKCSDDEEEEEDDDDNISNHKFVPTWASKNNILLAVTSQQKRDPDIIFSEKDLSDISKVLLPRKFQSR